MARQKLIDFQVGLMERLESPDIVGDVANWLAVEASGYKYLIPLSESGGLISLSESIEIDKVAHTKSWFLGVGSFRGASYAVVDLGGWLGVREKDLNLRETAKKGGALVVFHPSLEMSCALLVDKIFGLRSGNVWVEVDAPADMPSNGEYFADANQQVWQVLRLADLSTDDYFLSIEDDSLRLRA